MPVDLTRLGEPTTQKKFVPTVGPKDIPYVTIEHLNRFLNAEIPKKFADKAKVKYVDCQSLKGIFNFIWSIVFSGDL
jgi:hypothetical protein